MRDLVEVWTIEKAVFGWSGVYLKLKNLFVVSSMPLKTPINENPLISNLRLDDPTELDMTYLQQYSLSKKNPSTHKQNLELKTDEQWSLRRTLQSRVDLKVVLITNQDKASTKNSIPLSPTASEFITITGAFPLAESV